MSIYRPYVTLFVATLLMVPALPASDYEAPPTLAAADILPAEVVNGSRHHVESEVINDGYMNTYRIASDFGRFEAYGSTELAIRLREIKALDELDELSKSEVFANAVKEGALRGVKAVEALAEAPVATIKGVPQGVKKLFGRTKRSVEGGYQTAKGMVADKEEGEEADAASGEAEAEDKSRTEQAGELASEYLGVNAAQRRWSQKLGVDPYSSNEVLKAAIKQVAKVDSAGRFAVRLAPIPKIPGAGTIAKVNSLVWTMDAYELAQFNRQRLIEAGIPPEPIDAFYLNPHYSPTRQTLLITSLLSLEGIDNLGQALVQASSVDSVAEARFFVTAAQMLQWFHTNESPVARLLPGEGAFVAVSEDQRIVFHAPVDYLSWTEATAEAAARIAAESTAATGQRELWLLGNVSERCRSELETIGWRVETCLGERLSKAMKQRDDNAAGRRR